MAGIPPADIYARLLIPVDSTRGYPLWLPEPQDRLPEAYRDEGIRIGDVGIVTERGQFDILFNICLPRDHPINQRHGVPATFKQVELLFHDVCQFSHADDNGQTISSNSVRERNVTASMAGGSTIVPAQIGLEINFTSTSAEGAILVLPEGAGTEDLLRLDTFQKEARKNRESWYYYAYANRGRTAIHNDSIYLITGFHKSSSWGVATFSHASGSLNATFAARGVVEGNIAGAYSWQDTRGITSRVGPKAGHSPDKKNQAVSIRGFKIALREGLFALLHMPVKVSPIVPVTRSSTSRAYVPPSIAPGSRAQGRGVSQHQLRGGESSSGRGLANSQPRHYHPCDVINRFLLDKEPRAKIAVTHDSQWASFFKEGSPTGEDELIRHIRHHFHVKYDGTGTGSVHLERMQQESQSPEDEDKGKSSTERDKEEVDPASRSSPDGLLSLKQARLGAASVLASQLPHSTLPDPLEHEIEQKLGETIISAAILVGANGTNNTETLSFNPALSDVTGYLNLKGRRLSQRQFPCGASSLEKGLTADSEASVQCRNHPGPLCPSCMATLG